LFLKEHWHAQDPSCHHHRATGIAPCAHYNLGPEFQDDSFGFSHASPDGKEAFGLIDHVSCQRPAVDKFKFIAGAGHQLSLQPPLCAHKKDFMAASSQELSC
jgi:hypothetical protein